MYKIGFDLYLSTSCRRQEGGPVADPRIISWHEAGVERRKALLGRGGTQERLQGSPSLAAEIRDLLEDVRSRGDAALHEALARFDKVETDTLRVTEADMLQAEKHINPELSEAIDLAIKRSMRFNKQIVRRATWTARTAGGGTIGEIARPLESVGLFVPSGKGSFPSVMVQIGAPAVAAGMSELRLVVPPMPGSGGQVDPATLVVARRLGITEVYRLNGPSGVGALAYGTETVPKVRKIVGPGSVPVAMAQQLVQAEGVVVSGGLGPSDSLIVADSSADVPMLAADVINEAEHGPDSSAVLISTDRNLLERVAVEIEAQLADLPEPRRAYATASIWQNGGLVHALDLAEAWQLANDYAPEHIQIAMASPERFLEEVRYAGTALLGQWTTFSCSNFVIGTPATLPTTGYAKQISGVTAHTYLNTISMAQIGQQEFSELAKGVTAFAEHEGFPAHAASVAVRTAANRHDADGGGTAARRRGTVLLVRWRTDVVERLRRMGFAVAVLYLPSEAAQVNRDLVDYAEMVDDVVNIERIHGALARMAIPDLVGLLNIDEWSLVASSYVAQQFGLPAMDPDVAMRFRDKYLQKRRLHEAGVPTSRVELIPDICGPDVPAAVERFGYPAVLKPLAGAGAALTYRVDSESDLSELIERAASDSYGRRTYLIEEFQAGDEWHIDGYVRDGELAFFSVARFDEPIIQVHHGSAMASRSFDPDTDKWAYELVGKLASDALKALGLRDSVFHLEAFHRPDGQLIFGECAARPGGAMIDESVHVKFGVDLIEAAIAFATGDHDALPKPTVRPGVVGFTYLPSKPGLIASMPSEKELLERPGVARARYWVKAGGRAPDMTVWSAARVGEVVLCAPDAETYDSYFAGILGWFEQHLHLAEGEAI
ncbi:histidinol dehydrogenase [Actinoplanes sp. NEAU-A12]|uniref:Histidinol dehydrogenase n=1 Tax=Actinoplanes sandaracinus TaxID=3045177 RepID=A0ABT6WX40_9ACTN|nr:histidinol dehydrogenase [Actinoplanes sandaracinus]MDI6104304.1 histidinol dehydrogenase [Actinoplanes sandaracinus]